jgi:hypothetical protein
MEYQYFAVSADLEDLLERVETYYKQLRNTGHYDRIKRSYAQYYGNGVDSKTDKITPGGAQGELSKISINKYRSYLRHQISLITAERPATHVTPINTDYKSVASAIVGGQVLDYYMRGKDLEDVLLESVEKAVWSSEGWVVLDWDTEAGDPYDTDPDTGEMVMSGDVIYRTYSAELLPRDIYNTRPQWYITVDFVNKWDYAARYPEHKDEILNSSSEYGGKWGYSSTSYSSDIDQDRIALFRFYHKRTPALPEGKYVVFTTGAKLLDSALPFPQMPIYRISPAKVDGTNLGYTQAFDLLGPQEVSDDLYTAVISNNMAFSRQCVIMPRGTDVHHRDMVDGLTLMEADPEDSKHIRALQLTSSSPETYNLIDRLGNEMEGMTGINEVVRGAPGPNVRSGNAMALLSAQAIKFNSTLQQAYIKLVEDVGTATLVFLKNYAEAPRFAEIVDKSERTYLKEFSAKDLTGISRVHVESASALSKTQAGRVEIANNLLQNGMVKRPEQYIAVLNTGRLDPILEAEQSELMNIRAENEMMGNGSTPPVIMTDNHALHIREHRSVLDSPDARHDPAAVEAVLNHIQEHINLWSSTDPNVLAATGQQPMVAPPNPQGPIGNQEAAPAEDVLAPSSATTGEMPQMPEMPEMPEGSSPEDIAAYQQLTKPQ